MKNIYLIPTIILTGTVLASCSSQPNRNSELDAARSVYSEAQTNPDVTHLASVELRQAGDALDKANDAHRNRDDREIVNHLAYQAKQRVVIAQEVARKKAAELAVDNASSSRDKVRLEARTSEVESSKKQIALAQIEIKTKTDELATANANVEHEKQRVIEQTLETDDARQQMIMAQEGEKQKETELLIVNSMASQMEEELMDLNAKKTERGMVITFGDVLFDADKSDINTGVDNNLHKLATFLKDHPERNAVIDGYTDSLGGSNYNLDLSDRRANAVRNLLVSMGVGSDQLSTKGYGEENPVASNGTRFGRQMNRRVEVVLPDDNGGIEAR